MKENKYAVLAYWVGIIIVFASHLYMIVVGMPQDMVSGHAILNLVAGCLLAYSWFAR